MTFPSYPQRVRNELRFREITVLSSQYVSGFQRIVFGGEALAGFSSQGFDDHIKLFFPEPGQPFTPPEITEAGIVWPGDARPQSRDYTPLFDEQTQQLTLDFWVHDVLAIRCALAGRVVRWWCRWTISGSFMSAMNPACRRCVVVLKPCGTRVLQRRAGPLSVFVMRPAKAIWLICPRRISTG